MTKLHDLFTQELLDQMIAEGYVTARDNASWPLQILNYTDKCVWDKMWNEVTLNCRGLIWHTKRGDIIARGPKKFFNYGDPVGGEFDLDEKVSAVTDKVDGSLGIYWTFKFGTKDDDWASGIATRGSFVSEQALHATGQMARTYDPRIFDTNKGTPVFEIVYPENRIVLNYGDFDGLVHLGYVDDQGEMIYAADLATRYVRTVDMLSVCGGMALSDVLALPERANAEGYVVKFADGRLVKIKQADYLRLHKLITGLSPVAVWEHLSAGKSQMDIIRDLPDEFHSWAREMMDEVQAKKNNIFLTAYRDYAVIDALVGGADKVTRGEFASHAKKSTYPGLMFMILDNKSISDAAWKMVRQTIRDTNREGK